ncbi:hypothetical protein ABW19_dt0204577 [Dactylella cylindrospora]|nr:hypothetical protein ABW19_dt0204577 [Dactylella cylindrospora]
MGNDLGNDDDEMPTPPQLTSPLKDEEHTDTFLGTPGEVARRAVADNDRRASFAPDPFDRFRIFDNVDMGDDSVMQGVEGFQQIAYDDEDEDGFAGGDAMEGLSFADITADMRPEDDVSNFFNAQGLQDEETDFRLEHEGTREKPPELINDDSSPPPGLGMGGVGFVDSDFDSDEPIPLGEEGRAASRRPDAQQDGGVAKSVRKRTKKELPVSAYGIPYPSLPPRVVKAIIGRSTKTKLSKEALQYIMAVSETYFENLGEDLGSFARHAKRRTVEEADVLQVLKRHRLLNDKTTVFSLANQYLPRELLQDVRIQVPRKNLPKQRRRRAAEEDEGDDTAIAEE